MYEDIDLRHCFTRGRYFEISNVPPLLFFLVMAYSLVVSYRNHHTKTSRLSITIHKPAKAKYPLVVLYLRPKKPIGKAEFLKRAP